MHSIIQVIVVILICVGIYFSLKFIGIPRRSAAERVKAIEEKVSSIGGILTNVRQIKRINYPNADGLDLDDSFFHNFYRIEYMVGDKIIEGYSILRMRQSVAGPIGTQECEWIWKL